MVNSKITNWMQRIAQDTQDGVNYLKSVGVEISDNATLNEVILKMRQIPQQAPSCNRPSSNPRDYFDPLIKWDGQDLLDLWENDTRKNDFEYQMFVVINGAFDRQNFKANTTYVAQRNALAFETSDGVYYPPSTDTELWHEWDTEQDILDSNGNPVRYVKVYSNVAIPGAQTPYFNDTIRYCKYELQTNSSERLFQNYIQPALAWFESEKLIAHTSQDFLYRLRSLAYVNLPSLRKISVSGGYYPLSENHSLTYVNLPVLEDVSTTSGYFLTNNYSLKYVSLPSLVRISGTGISMRNNVTLEEINTPALVNTVNIQSNNYAQKVFNLPPTVQSYAITLTNNYALTKMFIPTGWNHDISIAQSNQMSREALVEVIMNFADRTSQSALIFNIGATNRGKLTEDDLLLASEKNITIS